MADKKITDLQAILAVTDDVNFPVDDGIQTYRATAPQMLNYINNQNTQPTDLRNYSLAASVATNALTIALKNAAGNNGSSTSPIKFSFRSATLASGLQVIRSVTGALTTVISSGSTAGHKNGVAGNLHIFAIDNAGTVELAWCTTNNFDEGKLYTTTAEGGAGGADSNKVLYSTTARSNVAIRYLGRMVSTQTTAGTWAAVPTQIASTPKAIDSQAVSCGYYASVTDSCTTSSPINFDTKLWDTHNAVTASAAGAGAWTFTAPFDGYYSVGGQFLQNSEHYWAVYINGSIYMDIGSTDVTVNEWKGSFTVPMNAGDTLEIRPDGSYNFIGGSLTSQSNASKIFINKVG